jgi:hypothetical protein
MGSEDTSDQSAWAVKVAKKLLKKQDDRSMKIKALAKEVYSEMAAKDDVNVNVNVDAVTLWIKQSDKFETEGNVVSLSKGKKRKRNDGVDAVPVPADHPAEAQEQGSNTGTPSSAKTVQVPSENSNNCEATEEAPKVMPVPADFDLKALKTAFRKAESAFKADKASRDLRRAKSAAKKALDEAIAATPANGGAVKSWKQSDKFETNGVSSTNSNNHDATAGTPKVMAVSPEIHPLETAYRQALSAFKADKTNKDLRRAKSAARKAWDEAVAATQDGEQLTCNDCSQSFMFTTGEREFYTDLCFDQAPTRCKACNTAQKTRLYDRSKRDSNNGQNMCYAFQHGSCKHGARCKFSHNPEFGGTPSAPPLDPGTPSVTPAGPGTSSVTRADPGTPSAVQVG